MFQKHPHFHLNTNGLSGIQFWARGPNNIQDKDFISILPPKLSKFRKLCLLKLDVGFTSFISKQEYFNFTAGFKCSLKITTLVSTSYMQWCSQKFKCACLRACVHACACLRACVHACAHAHVCPGAHLCVCVCVHAFFLRIPKCIFKKSFIKLLNRQRKSI